MLKTLLSLMILAACIPVAAEIDYAKANPPVELRAIWINADAIPKTENGIKALVQTYHKANLNVLLPEVVCRGYAVFPSSLLARDPRFEGAIDPLPVMIKEAHKLGMEVHPWVWVFRAGYTKDRGAILRAHPDWVELSKYGEDLSANGGLWISPVIPAARDFLSNLYCEIARKYDIDGLHLDYIRYEVQSPTPYGYSPCAREIFKKTNGIDPVEIDRLSQDQISWNRFRERQVNTFVQRVSTQLRTIKPKLIISAAVGSDITSARLNLMQNWANWVDNKWVDFLTPMAYTANDASFENLVSGQVRTVGTKAVLAPGIGLHMQKDKPEQTVSQIAIARKDKAMGQALFASAYYGESQATALQKGPYADPAVPPFRDAAGLGKRLARMASQTSDSNESAYLNELASRLAGYAAYKTTPSCYVPPTDPPLDIPEQVVPIPSVEIAKATSTITIDGSLDEPAWTDTARIQLSYDNFGQPASVSTTVMITYDQSNLYVAFEATEPHMDKIKATVEKKDGPTFYDDSVEIFVDPTMKRRDYYHLSTNTLGTRFDQKVLSPIWNGEWTTATKLGAGKWTTEIAIPFVTLGAPAPQAGTKWAINLTRNRPGDAMQYFTWSIPYGSFHSPDRFGVIQFK